MSKRKKSSFDLRSPDPLLCSLWLLDSKTKRHWVNMCVRLPGAWFFDPSNWTLRFPVDICSVLIIQTWFHKTLTNSKPYYIVATIHFGGLSLLFFLMPTFPPKKNAMNNAMNSSKERIVFKWFMVHRKAAYRPVIVSNSDQWLAHHGHPWKCLSLPLPPTP